MLRRCGWSFVAVDRVGNVTAAAYGLTPDWVDTIGGAEAWALFQAMSRAVPGSSFRVDCKPCVDMVHAGEAVATEGRRILARVFKLVFTALHDSESVVWIPAHTSESDVGVKVIGNGQTLTAIDREANSLADKLAKLAVEEHRVPPNVRSAFGKHFKLQEELVRWIGLVGYLANHSEGTPTRDTEASRKAGLAAAAARRGLRSGGEKRRRATVVARPVALGGHRLTLADSNRWNCSVCKRSSKRWAALAPGQCTGSVAKRLAARVKTIVDAGGSLGTGHSFWLSGTVLWCSTCGAFAEGCGTMALARPCTGKRIKGSRQAAN
jgi:hypothetical protein